MPRANENNHFLFLTEEEIGRFLTGWRELAATLREELDERGSALTEKRARELEEWLATKRGESVSIAEASDATGYSTDHLRRQLGTGELQNAGERGKPRVRRGDLRPKGGRRLAPAKGESYDPNADVRSLRNRRGA